MPSNYEVDTRGIAWWDRGFTRTVASPSHPNTDLTVEYVELEPEAIETSHVTVLDDHTIELQIDKDETP